MLTVPLIAAVVEIPDKPVLPLSHFDAPATWQLHLDDVEAFQRTEQKPRLLYATARGANVLYVAGINDEVDVQITLALLRRRTAGEELSRLEELKLGAWGRFVDIGELELKPWPADGKFEDGAIVIKGE